MSWGGFEPQASWRILVVHKLPQCNDFTANQPGKTLFPSIELVNLTTQPNYSKKEIMHRSSISHAQGRTWTSSFSCLAWVIYNTTMRWFHQQLTRMLSVSLLFLKVWSWLSCQHKFLKRKNAQKLPLQYVWKILKLLCTTVEKLGTYACP